MEKSKKRWLIVLGIVLLIGLIIIALGFGWFSRRGKAFDSRPLVLIISPENSDLFQAGDGIIVHATARENNGLARMELWVNDSLIDAVDAESQETTNLVLLSSWVPTFKGKHQIIVRATSSDGIDGQAMILVFTGDSEEGGAGIHTVEEGESLESIAEDLGISEEELEDLNPGLAPDGPAAGDDLIVPDTEAPAEESPAPGGGSGEPPSIDPGPPLVDSPFSIFWMTEMMGDDMVDLRLSVTALRTWEEYGSLHCYVGLGDGLPQWYPDRDHNHATDETFESIGSGWWNTEDTMQGSAAPVIHWPADQSLSANIFCVGTNGGTEAVEFERIDLEIPPAQWNGLRYHVTVNGAGGRLLVETQVDRGVFSTPVPPPPPPPDPGMTVPTDVWINKEDRTLEWAYSPRADELPIDGFIIYLNGTMQWIENEDTRESRLPVEWLEPPCGEPHIFGVAAFRYEGIDWIESYPGNVEIAQEDCTRLVEVTFLTLQTFNLGGDGSYEDRHGDVGPAYGSFVANRVALRFDHGHEGRGLDMPDGLRHNTTYDLYERVSDRGWHFSSDIPTVMTEVPLGGFLRVGAAIMDRDTGRCREEGDRGCNDQICRGGHPSISFEELIEAEGELFRSEFITREGRCRVEFQYRIIPSGEPGIASVDLDPLPWLYFIDLDVDPGTGETAVEIQNTGTAEWAEHPLTVELQTPDGAPLGQFTFEDIGIPVMEYETVILPATSEEPIFDVCVVLDPDDEVLELGESTETLRHTPICPGLPDLSIDFVSYEVRGGNWLDVTVQNLGDDDLENRVIAFELRHPDRPVTITDRFFTVPQNIPAGETRVISLGPLEDRVRMNMLVGYDLEVNPDSTIAEVSYENNVFSVSEGTRLAIHLNKIHVPYDHRDDFGVDINFFVGSLSGGTRYRQVVDWSIRGGFYWAFCSDSSDICTHSYGIDGEYNQYWFDINADETLIAEVTFRQPDTSWERGTETRIYYAPHWGAGDINSHTGSCRTDNLTPEGVNTIGHRYEWDVQLKFCRENYGEE